MTRFRHTETSLGCIYPLNCVLVHLLWEINIACRFVFFLFLQMIKFQKAIVVLCDFNPTENQVKIFTHCRVIIVPKANGTRMGTSYISSFPLNSVPLDHLQRPSGSSSCDDKNKITNLIWEELHHITSQHCTMM